MDRLTSMAVFVKAAELGSFSAAARAVDLSAPMVGKHVRFLEERLGGALVRRTTRRQTLTDLGRIYYEQCRRVLAEAAAADAVAAEQLGEASGRLRVTAPVLFGRKRIAPILVALAAEHPRLELEMSFSDRPVDLLAGEFDLAVRNGRAPDSADVMARRIFRQEMVVCAAPSYLARHAAPETLAALAAHDAVLYSRSGYARGWTFPQTNGADRVVTPRARIRLDDLEAIAEAAEAGHGLAWLPRWLVADRLTAGALKTVLASQPALALDSHALWLRTPHLPPRIRIAVDALVEALRRPSVNAAAGVAGGAAAPRAEPSRARGPSR